MNISMGRAKVPHHGFFQFGNPFKMLSPKGSSVSPKLLCLLNKFESTLEVRIKKIVPKNKDDILSLSWMKMAVELLCEIHNDINSLIAELRLPVCDWEDKWIDVYMDISVKLLDLCNAFSSELTHLSQGHLFLRCVLHHLKSDSSERYVKARSCLDSWRQHVSVKNPRIDSCRTILGDLVESLHLPKVKNSARGKVLMRALYGAKVVTVYVSSVFAAGFAGSEKNLVEFHLSDEFQWAAAFIDVQTVVSGKMSDLLSYSRSRVLKELEAVERSRKELYPMIEDGSENLGSESFENVVTELSTNTEDLTQGLDLLSGQVDSFFKIILSGRDSLLRILRSNNPSPNAWTVGNLKVAAK